MLYGGRPFLLGTPTRAHSQRAHRNSEGRERQARWQEEVTSKSDQTARENRLRRAIGGVAGFELRNGADGKYQIVFISAVTGNALPYENDLTLDDVELWISDH
jgi:hypothetical protein